MLINSPRHAECVVHQRLKWLRRWRAPAPLWESDAVWATLAEAAGSPRRFPLL